MPFSGFPASYAAPVEQPQVPQSRIEREDRTASQASSGSKTKPRTLSLEESLSRTRTSPAAPSNQHRQQQARRVVNDISRQLRKSRTQMLTQQPQFTASNGFSSSIDPAMLKKTMTAYQ
ncbi:unnamed protein product [Amoebophrya sp. A120]|nr:unnamed protein product [Amoebophrya sp. A120]|eukprot:GSA120T00002748001.1